MPRHPFTFSIYWDDKNSPTPGRMHYTYTTFGGEMSFDFDMLCMVGEPYRPTFARELKQRGIRVVQVDDDTGYYERIAAHNQELLMPDCNYQPPNPANPNAPYTCPRCGAEVVLVTTGRSRSKEAINPTTGEVTAVLDEDGTAEDVTWECESRSCMWWENADELEDTEEEEEDDQSTQAS